MTVRTFMSWPRLVVALVLMAAVVCTAALVNQTPRELLVVFGNEGAVQTMRRATSAKAWRLPKRSFEQTSPENYEYTAGPIEVPQAGAARLQKVLLDPGSYDFEIAKGCKPDYGVRVQFARGQDTVDVFFCFSCEILSVYHNGKPVGGEDFDDARAKILGVIKPLFKDDAAIQELPLVS